MLQAAGRSCFPTKPRARGFVFDKPWIQNLDCNRTIDEQMASAINSAHSANT
jgi:hypothetical protein